MAPSFGVGTRRTFPQPDIGFPDFTEGGAVRRLIVQVGRTAQFHDAVAPLDEAVWKPSPQLNREVER